MAGLATHPSAEPDTLVVRHGLEEREWLIEDAPETYYLQRNTGVPLVEGLLKDGDGDRLQLRQRFVLLR